MFSLTATQFWTMYLRNAYNWWLLYITLHTRCLQTFASLWFKRSLFCLVLLTCDVTLSWMLMTDCTAMKEGEARDSWAAWRQKSPESRQAVRISKLLATQLSRYVFCSYNTPNCYTHKHLHKCICIYKTKAFAKVPKLVTYYY